MSLVPDYSSSDSDSDNEPVPQIKKRSLTSILPPPKKTKLIQVELPKLQDDEEDDTPSKPLKSSVGLGLADLLPAPKNYKGPVPVTKTTTAFMPHALSRKGKGKQEAPVVQAGEEKTNPEETNLEEKIQEEEEEEVYAPRKYTGSFFHIGKYIDIYKKKEEVK